MCEAEDKGRKWQGRRFGGGFHVGEGETPNSMCRKDVDLLRSVTPGPLRQHKNGSFPVKMMRNSSLFEAHVYAVMEETRVKEEKNGREERGHSKEH